ncbi:hypothetical protein [Mycobacterium palustre]|uniref:Uncharacterized protein n=1 Tax=Mycobacterium palustre TaxID=153971 RepID=A0A1X1ZLW6_9MYCO|nr:hypothetical protein [Mycobacterium palustre]ORW24340.1 hypothetical protein AWC19_09530 [Mycobacterium palustre]
MIRLLLGVVSVFAVISAGWLAPAARAAENVTYEVVSDNVAVVDGIEYFDGTRRILLRNVPLPWRTTAQVANPRSLGTDGAEVRANWYTGRLGKFVMVRIYFGDVVRCENALDLGNAACYGSTSFSTAINGDE